MGEGVNKLKHNEIVMQLENTGNEKTRERREDNKRTVEYESFTRTQHNCVFCCLSYMELMGWKMVGLEPKTLGVFSLRTMNYSSLIG